MILALPLGHMITASDDNILFHGTTHIYIEINKEQEEQAEISIFSMMNEALAQKWFLLSQGRFIRN